MHVEFDKCFHHVEVSGFLDDINCLRLTMFRKIIFLRKFNIFFLISCILDQNKYKTMICVAYAAKMNKNSSCIRKVNAFLSCSTI